MKKNDKLKLPRIGILGFGREGKSVLKYLKKSPQFKKSKIEILDKRISRYYLKNLGRFDLIFRSPGVPYNLPELKKARANWVYFSSVTRLFFENYKGKVVGVTGTKGKGTTSTLLYQMLKAAGKRVFLAGNIGQSALDSLLKYRDYPLAVLELSSFQLQDLDISPEIAVMLDVFPDHQDAHTSLKEYYAAKANIGRFQSASRRKGDKIFYFADNQNSQRLAMKSPAKKFPVDFRKFKAFRPQDLKMHGLHNFRNAVMAATVAASLGVSQSVIKKIVERFRGLEHRLEFMRKIVVRQAHHKGKSEINFYNDSASTNPMTSTAAIESFGKEKKVLICGGQDKGLDYLPLGRAIRKYGVQAVILFGENKKKIKSAIKKSAKTRVVKGLKEAAGEAYRIAAAAQGVSNVIFSPGAASFDMFLDYAERGREFKKLVIKLTKKVK